MKSFKKLAVITLLLSIPAMSSTYYYNNNANDPYNGYNHLSGYSLTTDIACAAKRLFMDPILSIEALYTHPSIDHTVRLASHPAIVVCYALGYHAYSQCKQKSNDQNSQPKAQPELNEQDQQ